MRVCLVADPELAGEEALLRKIQRAHGLALIQVRARGWDGRSLARLTRRILRQVASFKTPVRVLVNGRLDVALATGAAGVHLQAKGLPVARVKGHVPDGFWVGVSAHCSDDLERAQAAGADYAFLGPVFPTLTHPGALCLGPQQLAQQLARVPSLPVWGIGGINPQTVPQLAHLPLAGVAAIRGLLEALEIEPAIAALVRVPTSWS